MGTGTETALGLETIGTGRGTGTVKANRLLTYFPIPVPDTFPFPVLGPVQCELAKRRVSHLYIQYLKEDGYTAQCQNRNCT